MPGRDVGGDVVQRDSAGGTCQSGEVLTENVLVDADGLEQLGAGVGGQRRDAHLGHHLQHALACGLDVVGQRLVAVQAFEAAAVQHDLDRLERHVRVDRRRTESDQRGHVMHLAGVTRLDDQADLGAAAFANQVVVHRRYRQQRRDRRQLLVGLPVGQDDDPRALVDRRGGLRTDVVQGRLEPGTVLGNRIQTANHLGAQPMPTTVHLDVGVQVDQLGQLVVTQDRLRHHDLTAGILVGVEQVTFRPDRAGQAGHHLFADGVQRRVGHLGEQLLEVVEQHPRTLRQHRDRRIGAHRAKRLGAGACHRRDQQVEFFVGVAEHQLP